MKGLRDDHPNSAVDIKELQQRGKVSISLVPRPHPLPRRNGLVNQVEFLGLAHTFCDNVT